MALTADDERSDTAPPTALGSLKSVPTAADIEPPEQLPTPSENLQSPQKSEPEEHTVAAIATVSTATTTTASTATTTAPASAGYQCCPGYKFHPRCFSVGPYVGVNPTSVGCHQAPGFPGECVCHGTNSPDPIAPTPYPIEYLEVNRSMAVSAGSSSTKLLYQVPYLVEEDRQFWVREPNGDYVLRTVKQIAEKQRAGHWANTCTGQPYFHCEPKRKIRYDPKDFNAVFEMSGLSHIEFHKRYQPF
ncbi:hypothetical protein ETB97_004021 [Aspergillus alliaceus]|uniref:Uncharacterized protein n=1 Tax=Petromyces alliaceus TaxID=209559 RepID=A0A5N7CGG2_PETAA|nr:hypothetical protein BDV23DRAFT_150689 [Aspergillus alliaceus]KAF5867101.1 hypothetical protein ETB97_004021 [Aspergillus burnettii]